MADTAADFHRWAKDAGNKLRAYMLSYASGATAVFFLALTGKDVGSLSIGDKVLLCVALVLYVSTTVLCLVELQVDARRFFYLAKQYERPENQRDWSQNEPYKQLRLRLLYGSYWTAGLATVAMLVFLVKRIT